MGSMEKSLTAEVKRRIEMNKSVQAWCEKQIEVMKEQFQQAIEERTEKIHERLEILSERITDLNVRCARVLILAFSPVYGLCGLCLICDY